MARETILSQYARRKGFVKQDGEADERAALIQAINEGKTYDRIAKVVGFSSANAVRQACLTHKLTFERVETVVIRDLS